MNLQTTNINAYSFEPQDIISSRADRLLTGISEIDQLDLRRLVAKSMDPDSGYGWHIDLAMDVTDLYRAFLFLCQRYPDEIIVPTREVDDFWHLHILDTRNYIADCNLIFGHYLHHYPYAGLPGTAASHEDEEKFIRQTIELVARHFPQLVDEG